MGKQQRAVVKEVAAAIAADTGKRNLRRLDAAATQFGVTVAYLKKLIGQGKLTRYKLGRMSFVDTVQFELLLKPGASNIVPPHKNRTGETFERARS